VLGLLSSRDSTSSTASLPRPGARTGGGSLDVSRARPEAAASSNWRLHQQWNNPGGHRSSVGCCAGAPSRLHHEPPQLPPDSRHCPTLMCNLHPAGTPSQGSSLHGSRALGMRGGSEGEVRTEGALLRVGSCATSSVGYGSAATSCDPLPRLASSNAPTTPGSSSSHRAVHPERAVADRPSPPSALEQQLHALLQAGSLLPPRACALPLQERPQLGSAPTGLPAVHRAGAPPPQPDAAGAEGAALEPPGMA